MSGVCNERFSRSIFAFSFLKENKLHMHLGPNHFFIEFLKSTKFVVFDLIIPGSEFHV